MTNETRTFIQAIDISGVEVECPKCFLTIFYPVAAVEKVTELLARCPSCNHDFFDYINTRTVEYPAINDLQKIAASLRSLNRPDRTDIHANIRFRVNIDHKAAS
jgi:hypothetical protein